MIKAMLHSVRFGIVGFAEFERPTHAVQGRAGHNTKSRQIPRISLIIETNHS
jgi:hypothetical protein